ncbi:hypothetical protein BBF96_08105 [Anoxybacter fermentans]|uniref:Metalloprotease TldD/E N-terminal domain-containing protein n=1 Tax=Anoxybacter fermentans TaxID=1323375 RepID=A0A3S9SYD4_9FIRM|nr:DNA gyrase modulator [Anoxybacter fermentans]AZR73347.1 hypothetical protein BBF96_08105 [Anoxybacter fermentans]
MNVDKMKKVLASLKEFPLDYAQIYVMEERGTYLQFKKNKLNFIQIPNNCGIFITVVNKGKLGYSFSFNFEFENVNHLVRKAIFNSELLNLSVDISCFEKNRFDKIDFLPEIYDSGIEDLSLNDKISYMYDLIDWVKTQNNLVNFPQLVYVDKIKSIQIFDIYQFVGSYQKSIIDMGGF